MKLDLRTTLAATQELAAPIAAERGLTLVKYFSPDAPIEIMGDAPTLRRLFWILLENALKFTEPSGTIEIRTTVDVHSAVVEICDNGVGIDTSDLPHIFDRFFRADPSRAQTEGSGLGLAIAKWIAEMHRATLTVTSVLYRGTTVRAVFPLAQTPPA